MINFKGRQVNIRDWIGEDLENYRRWSIGEYEWMKFNGPYFKPKSREVVEREIKTIDQQIQSQTDPFAKNKMVIAEKWNNKLIGTVNWYWQSKETHWISVGIVIYDDSYWGKGVGMEALGIWTDYLFATFPKIIRLDIRTWSGNKGMMRLAEKLDYKLEARFRKARIVDGEYFDSIGFGILREEWTAKYPNGFLTD